MVEVEERSNELVEDRLRLLLEERSNESLEERLR